MARYSNNRLKKRYRKSRKRSHRRARLAIARALKDGEQLIEDENGDGFVYIFDLGIDSLYKIGHSRNVQQRLHSFMVANPRLKLVLSVKVSDMVAAEGALHTQYAPNRQQGELFRFTEEELDDVKSYFPGGRLPTAREKITEKPNKICTNCLDPFVPKKEHWERCGACEEKKHNKTARGWSRWRNMRGNTHVHSGKRGNWKWGDGGGVNDRE